MLKTRLSLLLLLVGLLWGCSTAVPQQTMRYLFPVPPDTPRVEWLGSYASEDDFPKSERQTTMEMLVGKTETNPFLGPSGGVADGEGRVFVSDVYTRNIHVYDINNRTAKMLLTGAQLRRPRMMRMDAKKQLYVVDSELKKVVVLSREGQVLRTIGEEGDLSNPNGLALDEKRGRLYVSDSQQMNITVYDLDGRKLFVFGKKGFDPGQLDRPLGMAVGPNGNLYVADFFNARICIFDSDGNYLTNFGERDDSIRGMEAPRDLAFDSEGNLWVVDARRHMVRVFTADGELLMLMQGDYQHAMGFGMPTSITINPDDEIVITDFIARRFSHWRYLSAAVQKRYPITEQDLKQLPKQKE